MKETKRKSAVERYLEKIIVARNRSAMRPSEGIWYYVYLKPRWRLIVWPFEQYEEMTHPDAWVKYVVPLIIKYYGIKSKNDVENISNLPYSMPRGRCAFSSQKIWTLFHGDDFPSELSKEGEHKKIISALGLTKIALDNKEKVVFRFDDHEVMDDLERSQLKKIIKKDVPL